MQATVAKHNFVFAVLERNDKRPICVQFPHGRRRLIANLGSVNPGELVDSQSLGKWVMRASGKLTQRASNRLLLSAGELIERAPE